MAGFEVKPVVTAVSVCPNVALPVIVTVPVSAALSRLKVEAALTGDAR